MLRLLPPFQRGSYANVRYEEFENICTEGNVTTYKFPAYFEIRFAEH